MIHIYRSFLFCTRVKITFPSSFPFHAPFQSFHSIFPFLLSFLELKHASVHLSADSLHIKPCSIHLKHGSLHLKPGPLQFKIGFPQLNPVTVHLKLGSLPFKQGFYISSMALYKSCLVDYNLILFIYNSFVCLKLRLSRVYSHLRTVLSLRAKNHGGLRFWQHES